MDDHRLNAQAQLRARARRLGVLAERPPAYSVTEVQRERGLSSAKGIGRILNEFWSEGS